MQLERVFAAIPPLAFALLVVLVQASLHFVGYFDTASLAPLRLDFAYHFSPEPLTPAQAARTGFLPAELGDPRPAFADQHQWYRLRLANPGDAPQHPVLVVDNPIADVIRIYAESDGADAPRLLAELGDQVSVWDRELRSLPHHPLHVGAGEEASYLVEFVTEGTPFFPLTVMSAAEFDDFRLTKFGINAGFVAVLLIITCYSYLVFVGIGDRAYLAYVYYALAVLLSFGISAGYIHYLLPGPLSAALSRHIITVNGLVLIAALNFGLYFLRFDIENRRLFRWGQRFSLTVGVLALLSTQVPERVSGPLFTLLHLLSYLWIIVLLSYRLRDRFQWTRFYWISWIPFFVGSALVSGMFQGLVPYSIPVRFGALGAVIFEIAFMGTALADRLSRLEQIRLFAATHDDKLGLPTSKLLESRLSSLLQEGPTGQICLLSIEVSNYHAVTPFLSNDEFRKVMLGLVEGFSRRIGACHELQSIDDESAPAPFASLPQSEIIAFVMQVNDRASLRALLDDLSAIENHNPCPDSVPYRVECLFGAAFNDRDYGTPSDFLNESRIALSRARLTGRSFWIFDDEDVEQGQRRIRLAQDLDTAIREGQLELFHQPQLRVGEAAYPCSEVLLRWTHPSLGPINPDEAVNIAEQAGLMRRLTDWVIEESARHVASVSSAAGTA